MSFHTQDLQSSALTGELLALLIDQHTHQTAPKLETLWQYYRNDTEPRTAHDADRCTHQLAQSQGLPRRLTGQTALHTSEGQPPREIVIENDIAWRIQTLGDFMFGRPIAIQACVEDPDRAELIESFLHDVFDANGGVGFFQNLALLGSVHGHVDVLLNHAANTPPTRKTNPRPTTPSKPSQPTPQDAARFILEIIPATRAIPVLKPDNYRQLDAYVIHYQQTLNQVEHDSFLNRVRSRVLGTTPHNGHRAQLQCTQVWTDHSVLNFQAPTGPNANHTLISQATNRLGRIPVVHIQNLPQPFFYEGLSEVEPLIPLQNELNTRLSDRANRVTFQSFKMYLGKGIERFTERPVGPGQMWATDNPEATIHEFGGDAASPSEETHIREIRNALDKTSGVTPLAAGLLTGRIGNLTSENALRVTLMGLLSKTERKRITYGTGIQQMADLILHAADLFGILPNRPEERRIRIHWPSPLPENQEQRLREAKSKLDIGVPDAQVLTELGYGDCLPQ